MLAVLDAEMARRDARRIVFDALDIILALRECRRVRAETMHRLPDRQRMAFRLQLVAVAVVSLYALGWAGWDAFQDFRVAGEAIPVDDQMQEIGAEMLVIENGMARLTRQSVSHARAEDAAPNRQAEVRLADLTLRATRLQKDSAPSTSTSKLSAAVNALVAIQHRVFELTRMGRTAEAKQLLAGDAYEAARNLFAEGMAEHIALQNRLAHAENIERARSRRSDAIKTTASIVLLLAALAFALRSARRWQLLVAAKTVALEAFNVRLDETVAERTRELTNSAIASLNMMEDAVRNRNESDQAREKLDYLAYYDALTGLANRTLFLERLQAKLAAGGATTMRAVFVIDLQRFKDTNDAFGRKAADGLLEQIAQRLKVLGNGDASRFGRIGADLFVVMSPVDSAEQAGRYAEQRLDALFGRPFPIGDTSLHVSANVGIALFPVDGTDAETVLRHAEAAMKKAKSSTERVLFFTQGMTARVAERLAQEHRLRQAIVDEQFVLHYQPKVGLVSGKLTGVEALIRWNDPQSGLVPPAQFIPILEETGMIRDVGRWAMRRAIADYLRWCDLGLPAVRVAVNVSAVQLRDRDFVDEVRQAIGIDPRAAAGLELEITESMLMHDMQQAVATLQAIRAFGVNIAIDDFGTGFSSLGYLSKLPIDTLKIDRTFIADMGNDSHGLSLVTTIITLAHSLQLKVVAEGVETDDQARMLRLFRCDEMQGYLFSRPIARDALEATFLKASEAA